MLNLIKNIIFDVGNVIVQWSPTLILDKTFPELNEASKERLFNDIFACEIWRKLNLGHIDEQQAKDLYQTSLSLEAALIDELFHHVKTTQELVPGTVELIKRLSRNGYNLYALTDNIHEIVAYLRQRYDFWQYFLHVTVSAEVDLLKPDQRIYQHALAENHLRAEETVFIDDLARNAEGAAALGIHAIQFTDCENCCKQLVALGVNTD